MDIPRKRSLLFMATMIATIASIGSLYFSNIMGLAPCRLCWFQRIMMYPLVIVLGVSVWENRPEVYRTSFPIAIIGWSIAAFHSYIQHVGDGLFCTQFCSVVQFKLFGVLTIPNLSFIAFTAILGLLALVRMQTPPS